MHVDPHLVPHLIGRKGHTLTKLREQFSDVSICIPHEDNDDDAEVAVLIVYTAPSSEKGKVEKVLASVESELSKLCHDAVSFLHLNSCPSNMLHFIRPTLLLPSYPFLPVSTVILLGHREVFSTAFHQKQLIHSLFDLEARINPS
jgi:hypothetical protein